MAILYLLVRRPLLDPSLLKFAEFSQRYFSLLERLERLCGEVAERRGQLIEALEAKISDLPTGEERWGHIVLKRALYNNKLPPTDIRFDGLERYHRLVDEQSQLMDRLSREWGSELMRTSQELHRLLLANPLLAEGIDHAQPELADQMDCLLKVPLTKRNRHRASRLMSYALRAAHRTTPYATLAYTGLVEGGSSDQPPPVELGRRQRHASLRRIKERQVRALEKNEKLRIQLNPLLFVEGATLVVTSPIGKNSAGMVRRSLRPADLEVIRAIGSGPNSVDCMTQVKPETISLALKEGIAVLAEPMEEPNEVEREESRREPTHFIDLGASNPLRLPLGSYRDAEQALEQWCKATHHLSWACAEMSILIDYYHSRFPGVERLPLPEFYKHHSLHPPQGMRSQSVQEIVSARQQLAKIVDEAYRKGGHLSHEELVQGLAHKTERPLWQTSALVMPTSDGKWVLSSRAYQYGYGKGVSRFLNLFPELLGQVKSTVAPTSSGYFAELRSPESFNGNLYPPICDRAIYLPDRPIPNEEGIEALDWSTLFVVAKDDQTLKLIDGEGKRVTPVDLGFLDLGQRHPLYRLLSCFSPPVRFSLSLDWGDVESGAVQRRPRLIFEDHLILDRATWRIPPKALLPPKDQEEDWQYARRLCKWAEEISLPKEGFFRLLDPARSSMQVPFIRRSCLEGTPLARYERSQYYNLRHPWQIKRWRRLMLTLSQSKSPVFLECQELCPQGPASELVIYTNWEAR